MRISASAVDSPLADVPSCSRAWPVDRFQKGWIDCSVDQRQSDGLNADLDICSGRQDRGQRHGFDTTIGGALVERHWLQRPSLGRRRPKGRLLGKHGGSSARSRFDD
jgi:hypothetical protein